MPEAPSCERALAPRTLIGKASSIVARSAVAVIATTAGPSTSVEARGELRRLTSIGSNSKPVSKTTCGVAGDDQPGLYFLELD